MRILIKNGRVLDPARQIDEVADVFVQDGMISEIGRDLGLDDLEDLEIIDATGKVVCPGLIDMHVHLREPGFEYKETIATGTRAAAKGGFTTVACMPNTKPVIDNEAVVSFIFQKAKEEGLVNVYPIGAITKGLKGEEMAEIGELKFAGVVAISDDGRPVQDAGLMKKAMMYADMFDTPVISHCEELSLIEGGCMNEGAVATELGLKGIPAPAEECMVARDCLLAEYTGAAVHIAHVSTKGSVEIVRRAKKNGARVTCETCPHYFTLTEESVRGYNTNAKMNPPLRTEEDRLAVIEGLKDGTIDAIVTDHAPHHVDEKNVEFDKAANGIVGLETSFALGMTYLVKAGHLTLPQLIEKMSVRPAEILGLNKGRLQPDKPADIIVIDPDAAYQIDVSQFESKSKNSPFNGFEVTGKVLYTIVNGKLVMREGIL